MAASFAQFHELTVIKVWGTADADVRLPDEALLRSNGRPGVCILTCLRSVELQVPGTTNP
jgi:hypothetical protein